MRDEDVFDILLPSHLLSCMLTIPKDRAVYACKKFRFMPIDFLKVCRKLMNANSR